jgi:osmotically-inducible protein OsmY
MKRTFNNWENSAKRFVTILCVSVSPIVAGLIVSGCAGDAYHESTGESIDDTATTSRVKGALGRDSQYKYDDVRVTTFKGTVQLSGFVSSGDARSHAIELAKNTEGVKSVNNRIDVKE